MYWGAGVSVMTFHPPTHPEAWVSEPFRGQPCYYCADILTDPFVLWMGIGEAIAMHPGCVVELSIRLLRDVWEVECRSNTYVTTRDPVAELRARLRRQEGLR